MKKKLAFFDAKPYDRVSFEAMNRRADFGFDLVFFETRLTPRTVELCGGFDGVCVFVNDTVDAAVVGALAGYGVGILGLRCAGYNQVDFKAAYDKLHVARVPAYSPFAVAEHAVALMLTLNRKTHKAYARTRDGNFSLNGLLGVDFHGRTAGVIGTGQIGRCLIAILRGFGMTVLAYDTRPDEAYAREAGIDYVALDELYRRSDVISLHCPLTPETTHLIDAAALARMKSGVMIINTGRGKLIETRALIVGLKSGKVGAAGLDVYEEESAYFFEDKSLEPMSDDVLARLLTFPNVLVTSHQAFFTEEALRNIAETTLGNFRDYFAGAVLENEICYHCSSGCRRQAGLRCF